MLLAIIFIPILGAFALPILGRFSLRLRNWLALILILAPFVLSLLLASAILSGKTINITQLIPLGFNLSFSADILALFMALVSSLISAVIILYSFGYISHYSNQNEYYCLVVLFLGSMMGIIFSQNLILLYIFWEMTAIVSWRLIGFFRGKQDILRADKAFLITACGALLMLIGFISIYQLTGSFDIPVIKESLKSNPLPNFIVALILVGILSKSATLPLHTWLPDAGVAPSPVTALLHAAVLVKIGVYVFARLFVASFGIAEIWHTIVPVIAAFSTIIAAGAALIETDFKRIVAYSTISQIGFIFFALATNNIIGIAGGLLFILMHGLAKAGLFLCAGIVEQNTSTKDITQLGGLIKTMPFTAVAFLFCAFSVMGIPPFGGFFSKYLVFAGSVENKQFFISLVFLAGAVMTMLYLFRLFNMVFLGEVKISGKEGSRTMIIAVMILAILSLAGGILINYPLGFAEKAAQQMLGG
ncbi:MAG: NADH-quinone oxidoreductase subunit L [Candidatus Omnitrophica bacterium]|jgi:proton-translocating NADH-quinone oxidoreductase chain N|nr:NADH-quinone oxidoreductase subunit L [Candidatus Omnitrophota bacterium]